MTHPRGAFAYNVRITATNLLDAFGSVAIGILAGFVPAIAPRGSRSWTGCGSV